jgi:hypothetical protein
VSNRKEALLEAAAILQRVAADLDLTHTACTCCQRRSYANFDDSKAHEIVAGMVVKLENLSKQPWAQVRPDAGRAGG